VRILHISSARALGGGERHLAGLVCELASRGHEVHVGLAPQSPLVKELHALPASNIFNMNLRNALDVKGALELSRVIRERRVEIVHAHMARDYPPAAFAARRNKNAPLIITRHVLFPLNRLHALTLSQASRVIAVSHAVARHLNAQRIFPADKLAVVPNGVDFKRFDASLRETHREAFRRQLNIAPETLLIGTIGEIKKQKGHEEFLRAAASVASIFPNAEFIIAGADTSQKGTHLAALRNLVQQLSPGSRVHFTGWLDDVFPLLCALDLYVSASHTESFGLSIAEAMASALPVVSTATEGAREIIRDKTTGLLVPVGDAEAISRAIISLLENSRERNRLAAHAQESVRQRFSLEQMVNATEQIYLEALEAKAKR
jgi:glycosyltransferase involved in cell wall biosynthesis